MRIMSWNILYGFNSMTTKEFQPNRLAMAQEVIKEVDPDILLLVEACFGINIFIKPYVQDYKSYFNFPYYSYVQRDWEWGYALYSKFPHTVISKAIQSSHISVGQNRTIGPYNALQSIITTPSGNLILDSFHPYPFISEDLKVLQFEEVVKSRPDPYVLIGDFNTVSDEDFNPFNQVSKVIPMLKTIGMIDAFGSDRTTTYPTKMIPISKRDPDVRIDHCFVSGVKVKSAQVLKNNLTDWASDHYPLIVDIEL